MEIHRTDAPTPSITYRTTSRDELKNVDYDVTKINYYPNISNPSVQRGSAWNGSLSGGGVVNDEGIDTYKIDGYGSPVGKEGGGYRGMVDDLDVELEEFPNRGKVERLVETNLQRTHNTKWQMFFRILTTFVGEFVATFLLYTVILVGTVNNTSLLNIVFIAAAGNFFVASIFVRENVGHTDPMVTIAFTLIGKLGLPWYHCFCYLLAQPLAAIFASLFAWALSPGLDKSLGLGIDHLAYGFNTGQGLCAVVFGTTINYTFLIWTVASSNRENYYEHVGTITKENTLFSLSLAMVQIVIGLTFGPIVGPNFSWYLYFFPGFISGAFNKSHWWIWLVGPPLGMGLSLAGYYIFHGFDKLSWQTTERKFTRSKET